MSTRVVELCRRLGEAKCKELFFALNTQSMKKVLAEAGIPAVRLPSHSSTRKRNEDWASKLWKSMEGIRASTALLFEWLSQTRSAMLVTYLDSLGVAHTRGLTDEDFFTEYDEQKAGALAAALLESDKFARQDVAIYLLFLDATNGTHKFAALNLEQYLPVAA